MKVEKGHAAYSVMFEREDWYDGFAQAMVTALKTIPPSERKYDTESKKWSFAATVKNKGMMSQARKKWLKSKNSDLYDYDIVPWMRQFENNDKFIVQTASLDEVFEIMKKDASLKRQSQPAQIPPGIS